MALKFADRVQETTTTSGTGTLSLGGASSGFQSFVSGIGSGNTTYYTIYDSIAPAWEVGIGTVTSGSPNTLSRTTVLSSSNSGNLVSLAGNSAYVWCDYPSEKVVIQDASGNVTITGAFSGGSHIATETITGSLSAGAFSYGTLGYSDVNIFASYTSSVNTYNQMVLQNTNSGASASSDYVVSNNNGTATTYYGDYGINSSGWTGTAGTNSFNAPNMVYLTSTSTDLLLGTTTANAIRFAVNGGADSMTISSSGVTSIATPVAPNGMWINGKTISASFSIPSGDSAVSAGPITISSGVTITVPSGSKWVVL